MQICVTKFILFTISQEIILRPLVAVCCLSKVSMMGVWSPEFSHWWNSKRRQIDLLVICSWFSSFLRRYVHLTVHYIDVIMTTIASQITSLTVVFSTVYSDVDQRKHQSSASLAFVWGIHRDRWIPRTKGSYAENVSIWWRHHAEWIVNLYARCN